MFKRLFMIATLGVVLSGCYMVPMALVGPAVNGFTTHSVLQSAATAGTNYIVKRNTGKTVGEHAYDVVLGERVKTITDAVLQTTYFPQDVTLGIKTAP